MHNLNMLDATTCKNCDFLRHECAKHLKARQRKERKMRDAIMLERKRLGLDVQVRKGE